MKLITLTAGDAACQGPEEQIVDISYSLSGLKHFP